MNAFTSSDHTSYPFATTNIQDFRNLMSVYLDATLHPLLEKNDFTQEGWRIGPENPLAAQQENPDEDANRLVFKGVVYNEMKGQMSDASYLYYIRWQDHFFPAINNSGGDPQKITNLTWEQLRKFHADHYHPSNAKLLTYGNMPLAEHLKEMDQRLRHFDRIPVDIDVKLPIQLDGPKHVTVPGPLNPLLPAEQQYVTSVSWLMGDTEDLVERFGLGVLSSLLLDGHATPIYRSFLEADLGTDYSPNTGYDSSGKTGVFSVGLTSMTKENVPKLREVLAKTLLDVRNNGFEKSKVDGIIQQLEYRIKDRTPGFGMGLMQTVAPEWLKGHDPLAPLAWHDTLDAFKEKYAKGDYLGSLVEKYLLNDNTLTFTMAPSETFGEDLVQEESERLAEKISEATKQFSTPQEAQKYLEQRELELLKTQESARDQDLSCLPTVYVKDIPRTMERKPLRHSEIQDVKVQWREAPTNGLTYFRALHRLDHLPDELRELIPLFTSTLGVVATGNRTTEELQDWIQLKTGRISADYFATPSPFALDTFQEGLSFGGSALDRNIPDMYEIIRTVITETDFEGPEAQTRIRKLLETVRNNAISTIADSGNSFARGFADASLTPVAQLHEQASGLSSIKLSTRLASRPLTDSLGDVVEKLKAIQSFAITNSNQLRVSVVCDHESSSSNQEALRRFLDSLPKNATVPSKSFQAPGLTNTKTFIPLPYQVSYTARSVRTVPYVDASGAPLEILAQLLTHKLLHPEIREKGGAYGAGANQAALNGLFGMSSYRDPNPQNTMKVMNEAGRWARDRTWSAQDLEEAKLGVFQGYDAPKAVKQEGMRLFLYGITDDMAQTRRERLLDVTNEQVQRAADEYLVQQTSTNSIAVIGEKKDWATVENGWEIHDLNPPQAHTP